MMLLVHGPPGTGKTTHLAERAQQAALTHGAENVVIASLTRTAAKEIASRDTGIPEENIGTLHSHCFRALGLQRGDLAVDAKSLKEFNDEYPRYRRTPDKTSRLEGPPEESGDTTVGNELHARVDMLRARMVPPQQWTPDELHYHAAWTEWKTRRGLLDFTDLIADSLEIETHPARPRVILLDEAQDFSALELQLAKRWAESTHTTILVGDADQVLYDWRGSTVEGLLGLGYHDTHTLEQSHRVPRTIHAYARNLISWAHGRQDIPWHPRDATGEIHELGATRADPSVIVQQIQEDLAHDRTAMILATCGYMLGPTLTALRDHAIPYHNPLTPQHRAWIIAMLRCTSAVSLMG